MLYREGIPHFAKFPRTCSWWNNFVVKTLSCRPGTLLQMNSTLGSFVGVSLSRFFPELSFFRTTLATASENKQNIIELLVYGLVFFRFLIFSPRCFLTCKTKYSRIFFTYFYKSHRKLL